MALFLPPLDDPAKSKRADDGPAYVRAPLDPLRGTQSKAKSKRRSLDAEPKHGKHFLEPNTKDRSPRHEVCVEMLMGGNVDSFVELFNITNRDEEKHNWEMVDLSVIKGNLEEAELAVRSCEFETVYMAYKRVADAVEEAGRHDTCRHFRRKAQEAAANSGNAVKVAAAHHALGLLEEKAGDYEMATACYVDMYTELAGAGEDYTTACTNIVRTKFKLAEAVEAKGDCPAALKLLHDALAYSEKTSSASASDLTAQCLYKIGRVSELLGDTDDAVQALEKFMASSPTAEGRNRACAVLASCYHRRGDLDTAIAYLKSLVKTSSQRKQLDIALDSAEKLGCMYKDMSALEESVSWYTRAYDIAREMKEPVRIVTLRIALGSARAAMMRVAFVKSVQTEQVQVLLDWKAKRQGPVAAAKQTYPINPTMTINEADEELNEEEEEEEEEETEETEDGKYSENEEDGADVAIGDFVEPTNDSRIK